tara:strand:+ start:621 stop:1325 length:705 start_codon:yes stop_codon:yes gene_type:complete
MSVVVVGVLISAGASVLTSTISAVSANKARIRARDEKEVAEATLASLEANRQDIINPYEDVVDLSSMLSNPMENLGVATQAAEMQIEQADISLANTLDTLRATGASAGGATALAQAALQSKKGVSASIEQQEAQNEQLRARGEQALQQQQMAEAQRIQGLDASGKEFVFSQQELRDMTALDRAQNKIDGAQMRETQSQQAIYESMVAGLDGITASAGALGSADPSLLKDYKFPG